MKNEIVGELALVTGAGTGIGKAIAVRLAQLGCDVVLVGRTASKLEDTAAEVRATGREAFPMAYDLTDADAIERLVADVEREHGRLDVLVNNAGIMDGFEAIGDISDERWDQVFAVNVKGPMFAMRKAVQVMLGQKTRGNIVNVASIGGTNGARAGAAYTASKHALVGMTENTGYMYAHEGIRCNAICPGGVETEIGGSMMSGSGINQFGMGRAMAGLDKEIRTGKPEELAAAVLFVASDEASFMTGACVKVDGGVSVN